MRNRVCGGSAETRNYFLQMIYYCFSWSCTLRWRVRKKTDSIMFESYRQPNRCLRIVRYIRCGARQYFYFYLFIFFPPSKRKRERKSVPWRFIVYQTGTFHAGTYRELLKTFRGRNKQRKVDRININNGIYDQRGLAGAAGPKVRTRIGRKRMEWRGRCRRKTL